MKGKERCRILKEIRAKIAEDNDIEFVTSECKHKGDCLGTCPKCESELRYLEKELDKRRKAGKAVTVAGLAVSVALATSSCIPDIFGIGQTAGDMQAPPESSESATEALMGETSVPGEIIETEMGEIYIPPTETDEKLMGVLPLPSETDEELMGEPLPEETEDDENAEMGDIP